MAEYVEDREDYVRACDALFDVVAKGAVKTHKVVVTVLGTKAPASKGTSVYLALLKVKA